MITLHVFGYATIYHFCITELLFDNQKWMIYFTTYGWLSVFYLLFPVDPLVGIGNLDAGWSPVYVEVYL